MKLKLCLTAILLFAGYSNSMAQRLSIGDTCPVLTFKSIDHSTWSTARQPGIVTLICFWTTTCHGSVYTIRYLDSLQKQLQGKITVAAVSNEPAEVVSAFVKNEPSLKNTNVPVIAPDTILDRLFPHVSYPHIAWLDEKRIVRNITGAESVTPENILAFWEGKEPVLPLKEDRLHYNAAIPLMVYNNGAADTAFNYRSLFAPSIPGLPLNAGVYTDSLQKRVHVYCLNFTVTGLYAFALPEINSMHHSQFITSSMVRQKYSGEDPGVSCYDLVAPVQTEAAALQWMLEDINRYFGLKGRIEKRTLPCYAIVTTGRSIKYKSRDSTEVNALFNEGPKYMRNLSLNFLAHILQVQENTLPVVNATGYEGPATLYLPADLTDMAALSGALQKYGLDIIRTRRALPCFILEPSSPSSF